MKLDCVLTAVNDNPLYIEFIPIFIKTWNKLYPGVDVKIILISKKIPDEYMLYKDNIILFEPIDNVLTSFTSQLIRLLYPCILNYENGVMITDMDILPMNKTYYTEYIKDIDNSKFVYYRGHICGEDKQLAMCYNVCTPNVWKDIFNIHSVEDIKILIQSISYNNIIREGHGNIGWDIDQRFLYLKVMEWKNNPNNVVFLFDEDTKYCRLSRHDFTMSKINNVIINNMVFLIEGTNATKLVDDTNAAKKDIKNAISDGYFSDYHCYRPMSMYTDINNKIYNLLPD